MPSFARAAALLLLLALTTHARAHDPAAEMTDAAQRFVAALDDDARAQALQPFDGEPRTTFYFVPRRSRPGVSCADMTPQQRLLAHRLLHSAMSHHGYRKAITIMALEKVLHEIENRSPIRDPQLYWVAIFGTPGDAKAWGWRFEGHHLSLSFTIVGGKHIAVTPSFFGANPAHVSAGPMQGLAPLADEEQLARAFVQSLTPEQRDKAIIADRAPRDIITGQQRTVDRGAFAPAQGIAFDDLTDDQRQQLLRLVAVFTTKYRPEIVEQIDKRADITTGKGMTFAWAGGLEPGQGHYYRVQTPDFLFEYDNTQNNANHIHTVWRSFDGDFGADLLRQHYENTPHPDPTP